MEFWLWLFISIAIGIIIYIIKYSNIVKKQKLIESHLSSLPEFSSTQQIVSCDGNSGIAIDESQEMVCLIVNNINIVSERIISYKDIISVEIFEDNASIAKTIRTSQIGGAVAGGLLFGGVGAIIGGLSGKTETSKKIKRVDLRLVINDKKNPLHDVVLMDAELGTTTYNEAIKKARHWHAVMEIIIKQDNMET